MMSFENIKNDLFKNKFYVNIKNDSNSLDQNSTTESKLILIKFIKNKKQIIIIYLIC